MTQPPYRLPEDRPMRRFAIFAAVLIVIVAVGSRPAHRGSTKGSFCVCLPSRAGLILKSMVNGRRLRPCTLRPIGELQTSQRPLSKNSDR